jgi:hypothetical protein
VRGYDEPDEPPRCLGTIIGHFLARTAPRLRTVTTTGRRTPKNPAIPQSHLPLDPSVHVSRLAAFVGEATHPPVERQTGPSKREAALVAQDGRGRQNCTLTGRRQVLRFAFLLGLVGEIRVPVGPLRVPVSSEPGLGGAGTAVARGVPNGCQRASRSVPFPCGGPRSGKTMRIGITSRGLQGQKKT